APDRRGREVRPDRQSRAESPVRLRLRCRRQRDFLGRSATEARVDRRDGAQGLEVELGAGAGAERVGSRLSGPRCDEAAPRPPAESGLTLPAPHRPQPRARISSTSYLTDSPFATRVISPARSLAPGYFTVTLFARLRGLSGSWPRKRAR